MSHGYYFGHVNVNTRDQAVVAETVPYMKLIISSLSSASGCPMMDSAVRPQYIALRRRCAAR